MKKFKFLTVFAAIVILCISSFSYAYSNEFTWFQSTGDYYVNSYIEGATNYNVNNDIRFYANVYSPNDGTFEMTLQKKTWWWWSNVSHTFVKVQNRHGWETMGSWWSPEAGEYRVVLHTPSNPQATVFKNVRLFRYH